MARARAAMSNPERGAVTRRQILETAGPLIARRGGRGISMAHMAAAAGVSKTGLMHHFPTKEALLHAVVDTRDELYGHPKPWPADAGLEALDVLVDAVGLWASRPGTVGVYTALLSENLNDGDPLHDRLQERARAIRANVATAIEVGKCRGDVRADVDSDIAAGEVVSFFNGLETYWLLDPTLPAMQIAEQWRASKLRDWRPTAG